MGLWARVGGFGGATPVLHQPSCSSLSQALVPSQQTQGNSQTIHKQLLHPHGVQTIASSNLQHRQHCVDAHLPLITEPTCSAQEVRLVYGWGLYSTTFAQCFWLNELLSGTAEVGIFEGCPVVKASSRRHRQSWVEMHNLYHFSTKVVGRTEPEHQFPAARD